MIKLHEVEAAARSAFPGQSVLGMRQLPKGFDFEVYRVDLEDSPEGESLQRRLVELKNALVESLGKPT